jgi:ABC-2 type transport system permease protein
MTTTTLPAGRTLKLGLSRVRNEVRSYFRQGDSVFFTFLFPLVMLTIFSTAFSTQSFGVDANGDDLSAAAYYLPGMLAAGLATAPSSGSPALPCRCSVTSSARSGRCS